MVMSAIPMPITIAKQAGLPSHVISTPIYDKSCGFDCEEEAFHPLLR
jgi:hypothetical protein